MKIVELICLFRVWMEAFILKEKVIFLPFNAQDKKNSLCEDKRHIFNFQSTLLKVKWIQTDLSHIYLF